MRILGHIGVVLLGLLVCLGVPCLFYADTLAAGTADAVSGASMDLPDQPSGDFIVVINRDKHPLTLAEWTDFFEEKPVDVIMEDISVLAAASDSAGVQLAERYQARLAERQMKLAKENGLLVVSRAENGLYDVVILSREMADALDLSAVYARGDAAVVEVRGAEE